MAEPTGRRERKKEQTRRALTKAALDLFLIKGLASGIRAWFSLKKHGWVGVISGPT